jgi:hypothetical protein
MLKIRHCIFLEQVESRDSRALVGQGSDVGAQQRALDEAEDARCSGPPTFAERSTRQPEKEMPFGLARTLALQAPCQ